MGVLDVLSGLATAAGKGYEGYANDQAQGVKDALAQQKADADAKRNALLNLISQRDLARLAPGDPGYGTYKAKEIGTTSPATAAAEADKARALIQPGVEKINADAQPTANAKALEAGAVSPITTQTAVNTARGIAPIRTAQAIATAKGTSEFAAPIATQDDPGNPASPVTYKTRSEALGTGKAPGAGGGAGRTMSGSAQAQQARMMAAVSEARLADTRMRTFEDGLLAPSGTAAHADISPLQQAGGTLMTNLSGAHGALGALTQAGTEAALNANSPAYAQYLRDAMTIGRAEQMMSPRGGNETMVRANALLSRAGTGAMANTIDASRQARQALFGPAGGIEQTLTPAQSEKLKAGVQSIRAGSITGGTATASPAPSDVMKKYGLTPPPGGDE